MEQTNYKSLIGMKEIQEYCRSIGLPSSTDTILSYIREYGLPARKLKNIWAADRESIVNWYKRFVDGDPRESEPSPPPILEPAESSRATKDSRRFPAPGRGRAPLHSRGVKKESEERKS